MSWDAAQYSKFEDERTRPVHDLVGAIPLEPAGTAIDLGCGPGNSTQVLAQRFPGARLTGLDSSPEMIAAARARLPSARFEIGSIEAWRTTEHYDVILANAVLHWVPDHAQMLPSLVERLAPGGCLAVQIPDNLSQPSHLALHRLAAAPPWGGRLHPDMARRTPVAAPEWYLDLLQPHCSALSVWRTDYYHRIAAGIDGIVEWFKGSALGPFLGVLGPVERTAFLADYRAALDGCYTILADGSALLPFPRFFLIAVR